MAASEFFVKSSFAHHFKILSVSPVYISKILSVNPACKSIDSSMEKSYQIPILVWEATVEVYFVENVEWFLFAPQINGLVSVW